MANKPIITDVTYSELVNLITTNGLTEGLSYLLTDFQTVHYMFDGGTRTDEINTCPVEPLLLTADSPNTFKPEVYSSLYPQDIITYDWKSDYFIQDVAFSDFDINGGGTLMNPDLTNVTLIPNYKGVIYKREDTRNNVKLGYDFRHVKFRRWKRNDQLWDSGTTYNIKDKVQVTGSTGGVYSSLVSANTNNAVTDVDYWTKIVDYVDTEYWNIKSSTSSDPLDYIDCLTFQGFDEWNNYEVSVKNVDIKNVNDTYSQFSGYMGSSLSNSVFYLGGSDDTYQSYTTFDINADSFFELNTIGNYFYNNTIGNNFSSNTIGNYFHNNTIGINFNTNTIGNNFYYNTIGNNFYYNTIGINFYINTIGISFQNNTIGNNFTTNTIGNNFTTNTIGNDFYTNTIGNSFNTNTIIGDNFYYNTIFNLITYLSIPTGVTFQYNTIKDGLSFSGIDFTLATHVYAAYNTEILKTPNGTLKLMYVDDSGVQQIVASNS